MVPAGDDLNVSEERLVEAIDEETLVVAFSHVLFRTSFIVDPRPVIERAHRAGALAMLDVYQSAGIVPLNVTDLDVDFANGGCLKWLCGGPGNGFLYTRPDLLRTLTPRFTGWLALAHPFAFDIEPGDLREDGMRMMNGTPPIPAYYAAIPGLEIVAKVGVEAIREKSCRMTARLLDLVDARGWRTRHLARPAPRGGHRRDRRARRAARLARPQGPRCHRRLPSARRHPRVPAFLQYLRGTRPAGGTWLAEVLNGGASLRRHLACVARHARSHS